MSDAKRARTEEYDWKGTALATAVGDKIPSIELDFEFG